MHTVADPDLRNVGRRAGDASRSIRVVDDLAGVSRLADSCRWRTSGAFASGIRPARWFGSRLLPLVSVAIPGIYLNILPHWWLLAFPLLILGAAILVSDILWEAETRDF